MMDLMTRNDDERLDDPRAIGRVKLYRDSLFAAINRAEEAERKVCAMREAITDAAKTLRYRQEYADDDLVDYLIPRLEAVLASAGCPHEEEAKRLEEVVKLMAAIEDTDHISDIAYTVASAKSALRQLEGK